MCVDSLRASTVAIGDKITTGTDSTEHVVQGTLSGQSSLSRTRTETLKTKRTFPAGSALALELKKWFAVQVRHAAADLQAAARASLNATPSVPK